MTYQKHFTATPELLAQLLINGLDGLFVGVREILIIAMKIERPQYLGVGPYE